ncbi:MAG: type II CRISPR-associated endonuclease Cas1 [Clostridia bacterium]|nr:type II CRISPR-associated endonuclease Cas1 [Clostridia bacterium]
MGFRTVVIKSRVKLEHRLNYLVIRGEVENKIFLNEINTLIIQSTAVSLTASLLNQLTKNNVKVIFCDEKCNPSSELLPYYGAYNSSKRYLKQMGWNEKTKNDVWDAIITQKIRFQAQHLCELGFKQQSDMLYDYANDIHAGDVSNREGHAAKVYFNCLFQDGQSRGSGGFVNDCLNYGYTILLSAFNREIVSCGYLTQIGIWHKNEFNEFNLACDFMEPFRIVVDKKAFALKEGDDFKKEMINLLNCKTKIDDKMTTLDIAIGQYTKSIFKALELCDVTKIVFPQQVFLTDEL